MKKVRQTEQFARWLDGLRDRQGQAIIVRRIKRFALGNPGDSRSVGDGVFELRIHFSPGYRVYFAWREEEFILLLGGGDKDSQPADIARAKKLASEEATGNDFEDDGV